MKIIFTTILSLVALYTAYGQNFEVVEESPNIQGRIGEKITTPIKIRNKSDKPLQIVIRRIDQVIGTSQKNYFCWGEECYEAEVSQIPLSKRINPGEVSSEFTSVLEAGLVAGFSTVKYLIFDRDNPSDALEYELTFTVEDGPEKQSLFASDEIMINDVYPNPVTDFAMVDYNLLKEDSKAKIIIHNVLGSIIGEYDLPYLETRLKIKTEDFNPGVYFYTLYIDNEGVMTRKLVIRK